MRIAVTGHRGLPPDTENLVGRAIRQQLAAYAGRDVVGVSNLADGADQLFAQAVLDAGGQLEVIVPAARHGDGLPASARAAYGSRSPRAPSRKLRLMASSWTSMQIATLVVDALTPITVAVLGFFVVRASLRIAQVQWANQTVVTRRLDIFGQLAPGLNGNASQIYYELEATFWHHRT